MLSKLQKLITPAALPQATGITYGARIATLHAHGQGYVSGNVVVLFWGFAKLARDDVSLEFV